VGIPTSRNPDTLEGIDSQLSVGIRKIPAELLHSTKLELKKLRQTQMDSGRVPRSSYFEDSRQARKSSGPQNLASLSTLQRMNLGAL
jgi:hypothetical protein